MYNPKHFKLDDLSAAQRLMREHPLALLIGPVQQNKDAVTHAPLILRPAGGAAAGVHDWCLEGHMARANPHQQWMTDGAELLAVFSGPDAYVSPGFYETPLNVPTWNYLTVHVSVRVERLDDAAFKDAVLKRLIAQHEPSYAAQWRGLPPDYQAKMLAAIVGFRLHVQSWEFKAKLSQNRAVGERERMRAQWAQGSADQQELAQWMSLLDL
ncbi:MAG: FMN-binding negative transcriptional regulator [Burkholderiaceae bacterium]|nr:FMN-binding negative transcriptional regulator [Roseateles sp.]MBV8469727.1 FMN-binding negative transcriptional regulator [Burkholderiaceae bacterium]